MVRADVSPAAILDRGAILEWEGLLGPATLRIPDLWTGMSSPHRRLGRSTGARTHWRSRIRPGLTLASLRTSPPFLVGRSSLRNSPMALRPGNSGTQGRCGTPAGGSRHRGADSAARPWQGCSVPTWAPVAPQYVRRGRQIRVLFLWRGAWIEAHAVSGWLSSRVPRRVPPVLAATVACRRKAVALRVSAPGLQAGPALRRVLLQRERADR